jgi:uncharacterized membrane protein YfcA
MSKADKARPTWVAAFASGAVIGALGGLVGLGGAEFRLPILIGRFGFAALRAVILNKAMSLIVVTSAILSRTGAVPLQDVGAHWPVIVNLLVGSLFGAWVGASWATKLNSQILHRLIAGLLVMIAIVLVLDHYVTAASLSSLACHRSWPVSSQVSSSAPWRPCSVSRVASSLSRR